MLGQGRLMMTVNFWKDIGGAGLRNVVRIVIEDEAGCGGPYAMFSGLIEATGSGMAEVRVIKTVVEMFISMGWHEKVPLVIESSTSVVQEWLLDRSYRPWMLWNLFIGIDCGINQLLHAQFAIIHQQGSNMANDLAKASIKRSSIFKA
ncbi:hypothetical protein Gotur_019202 [Gossypium turneri]